MVMFVKKEIIVVVVLEEILLDDIVYDTNPKEKLSSNWKEGF